MKVVGIGFQKTGTTTLGRCLEAFGFRHRGWDIDLFRRWSTGDVEGLMEEVRAWESFEDFPWPFLYEDIDRLFPNSRFILTLRQDADTWYDSVLRWVERKPQPRIQRAVYGCASPRGRRQRYIERYEAHNEAVRAWFTGREDRLLEVCWERGDGWDQLARFLGRPAPDGPFPHANPGRRKHWLRSLD